MVTKVPKVIPERSKVATLPMDRVIHHIPDDDAQALAYYRGSSTVGGRDPVHLSLERTWFTNIANFLGLQRVESGEMAHLLDPNFAALEAPFVANHILRIVMGTVSRMAAARPQTDVLPKSTDTEDQIGAKVGDFFLKHYEDALGMREMKREMALWLVICGTAGVSPYFNPKGGPSNRLYKNPYDDSLLLPGQIQPEEQAWLEQMGAYVDNAHGQVEAEVLSPFQIFTPHGHTRLKDMPWIVIEHDRSFDWLWEHYPEVAKEVGPEDMDTTPEAQYARRLASMVGRHGFSMPSRADDETELVRVRTLWYRPSARMPKGRKIVITKNTLLENVPHPLCEKFDLRGEHRNMAFPLVVFRYCAVPGRFWGTGLVEHLIPLQREYNKTRWQMMQMRDILAHPQWMAPKNAELTSTRNDYGDLMEYGPGHGKPELVNPPSVSQIHLEAQQSAILDMQTISAQSEVSQAQVPQGVRSGVAIQALQEKDLTVVGITVEDQEDGWRQVSEQLLALTDKYVKTPQMIHLYGEFRGADVVIHKGSDIKGNTRVRVVPGSMMPKSKAASKQMTLDMVGAGILQPALNQKDKRVVMKALEVGDADKYFEEEDLDRRRADIENQMFLRPQVDRATGMESPFPDVNEDDDHQVHLERHMVFKKTDAYEKLPFMRKMAHEAHMAKHKEAIAQLMQTQALMAGMAGGGESGSPPKEKGQPSQPAQKQQAQQPQLG